MRHIATLIIAVVFLGAGCGKGEPEKHPGIPALFTAAKNTTPVFTPSTQASTSGLTGSLGVSRAALWTWGDPSAPLYWAYNFLRDFVPPASPGASPTTGGTVDMTNMYFDLFTLGGYMDNATGPMNGRIFCQPISQAPTSPYDFGGDLFPDTYDCGGNAGEGNFSLAYREEAGGKKHMLVAYNWSSDPARPNVGVFQVFFDSIGGDVNFNYASYAEDANGGPAFGRRTQVLGNSATHAFTIRTAIEQIPAGPGGMAGTLVGKGISQGARNYFLFKFQGKYFCLPAGATEADLRSLDQSGSDAVEPNCAQYQADVDALVPFASMPGSRSDFTGTDLIYMF